MFLAAISLGVEAQNATNQPPEPLPLIPEDVQLLKESMLWQQTLDLRTGAGYRDNVLLSPSAPQGSAFLADGLDYSASRLPLDGWGVSFVASGDDNRYLQNVPSDGTDFWLADLTVKRFLGDHWQAGMEGTENYLDEVDLVDTAAGPTAVEVQGNILKLKPLSAGTWAPTGGWNWISQPLVKSWTLHLTTFGNTGLKSSWLWR